jgi:hypothetical protein
MPEPKIERYETITVETTQQNQYGDLMVNGTLKVGKKRSNLFDVFQPGAEVKLGYASYMNKEYIATAEQTGTHTLPEEGHLVKAAKAMGAVPVNETPKSSVKDRAVAISYAKDLAIAGKIELKDMSAYADKFLEYMNK